MTPQEQYKSQLAKYNETLQILKSRRRKLGRLRLAIFLVTVVLAYLIFSAYGAIGLLPTLIGIGLLLYVVSIDAANNQQIRNTEILVRLNEEELEILQHRFATRENGSGFAPAEHAYASDLDVLDHASMFQWLNRCFTEQGQALLAQNLLQPSSVTQNLNRHQAVKQLAQQLDWRQQWQAFAMQAPVTKKSERRIAQWLAGEEEHFTASFWRVLLPFYAVAVVGSAIASILGLLPPALFSTIYLFSLITSMLLGRKAGATYTHLGGIVAETNTLQSLLNWFEGLEAEASLVKDLQSGCRSSGSTASSELKELKRILDRFDLRISLIGFLVLNPFLLWDVRQLRALNAWRRRNRHSLAGWFAAVAEMEVLHTLSTLHFNWPHWVFPQFAADHFTFEAAGLGHPLLPESQRVDNNFSLRGVAKIGLITGSNMAGKSTFLRSLGLNAVLAQMGAPVCATTFVLSPVQVLSSMRITDDLSQNTSTFYAELKKLRTIIERVKAHEKVFVLLDEILRGTNSFDRHKGSEALIKQLIREEAVAVIATHDVELGALQKEYPANIANYHFDVTVQGEELYFDYRLKDGICQSLNATLLMKKIGIDLDNGTEGTSA